MKSNGVQYKNPFVINGAAVIIVAIVVLTAQVWADDSLYAPGEVIVRINPAYPALTWEKVDNVVMTNYDWLDTISVHYQLIDIFMAYPQEDFLDGVHRFLFPEESDALLLVGLIENQEGVLYAQPNGLAKTQFIPNDEYYLSQQQWYYQGMMHMQNYWGEELNGSPQVKIGILEDMFDWDHEDLVPSVWFNLQEDHVPTGSVGPEDFDMIDDDHNGYVDDVIGFYFRENGEHTFNFYPNPVGHPTEVAGLVAARTDNEIGIASIAGGWAGAPGLQHEGCKLVALPCQHTNFPPFTFAEFSIAQALHYAEQPDPHEAGPLVDVVNMSFTLGDPMDQLILDAVQSAYDAGVIMVASAGYDVGQPVIPGSYEEVIAVMAVDENDVKVGGAGAVVGDYVDISAPGANLYSTEINNSYIDNLLGNSYATAIVSSMAGAVRTLFPNYSPDHVRRRICTFSAPIYVANHEEPGLLGAGRADCSDLLNPLLSPLGQPGLKYFGHEILEGSANPLHCHIGHNRLVVDVKNWWHDATSVTSTLMSNDPYVSITQGNANYINIFEDQIVRNDLQPFQFDLSEEVEPGHLVSFILHLSCNAGAYQFDEPFIMEYEPEIPGGFPIVFQAEAEGPPTLVDLDPPVADGDEVLLVVGNEISTYDQNGQQLWLVSLGLGLKICGPPAIADVNYDNYPEIFVTAYNAQSLASDLFAFSSNGVAIPGWHQTYPNQISSHPVLAYVDQDEMMEVIVPFKDPPAIAVFDLVVPPDLPHNLQDPTGNQQLKGSIAVGDINCDGWNELVCVTNSGWNSYVHIYQWNEQGFTELPLSPHLVDGDRMITGTPVIAAASLNPDAPPPILLSCFLASPPSTAHIGFMSGITGQINWAGRNDTPHFNSTPSVYKDDSHILSMVYCEPQHNVQAMTLAGGHLWTGPEQSFASTYGQVNAVNSVGNDGLVSGIFVGSGTDGSPELSGLDRSGFNLPGFPIPFTHHILYSPSIGDMGGDGHVDVAAVVGELGVSADYAAVYVFETQSHYDETAMQWTQLQHDLQRTGNFIQPAFGDLPDGMDIFWSGDVCLANVVTVPENTHLKIMPGTRIHADADGALIVNGQITVQGTKYYPVTFRSLYPNNNWVGIKIYSQVDNQFTHCTITNAGIGLRVLGGRAELDSCSVQGNIHGIVVLNEGKVEIRGTSITDNSGYGSVVANNSGILFEDCTISGNDRNGVWCASYGRATFNNCTVTGNGNDTEVWRGGLKGITGCFDLQCTDVITNDGPGIASLGTFIEMAHDDQTTARNQISENLATQMQWFPGQIFTDMSWNVSMDYGYNTITDADEGHPLIVAWELPVAGEEWRSNYWGSTDVQQILLRLPNNVEINPILDHSISCDEYPQPQNPNDPAEMLYYQAWQEENLTQFETAIDHYQLVIDNYPESKWAKLAVDRIVFCKKEILQPWEQIRAYFLGVADSTSDPALKQTAYNAAAWCLVEMGNYQQAQDEYLNLLNLAQKASDSIKVAIISLMAELQACGLDTILSVPNPGLGREISVPQSCAADREMSTLYLADALLNSFNIHVDNQISKYSTIPEQYELHQNYPNPFNSTTIIRYGLPTSGNVNITIYNVLGQKVATLLDANQSAGYHKVLWNGRSNTGITLGSGMYFYCIKVNNFVEVRKMVLLR